MLHFELPDLDGDAEPEFTDAKSCKKWLAELPLTNIGQAHGIMCEQLALHNVYPLAAAERLRSLEALRDPLFFVQFEFAKRFTNKPLPLSDAERGAFEAVIELWRLVFAGYARCIQACLDGDKGALDYSAPICQRAIRAMGAELADFVNGGRQVPASYWTRLHSLYQAAEQLGVANSRVKDALMRSHSTTTCAASYAEPLLIAAANPNELSLRQVRMMSRWLERWSEKIIFANAPTDKDVLGVDLSSAQGAFRLSAEPPPATRYIDTADLGSSIKKRIVMLRKGETPVELGLGEECIQPACEQLLIKLYQHWCEGKAQRQLPRRGVSHGADICVGLPALHYFLTGQAFRQPGESVSLSRREVEDIATFGRVSMHKQEEVVTQSFLVESWNIQDETVAGLRIVRPGERIGGRLTNNQLVGIKPTDSKTFLVASIQWLMTGDDRDLHAGVKIVPGAAVAAAGRIGGRIPPDKYEPILLMP